MSSRRLICCVAAAAVLLVALGLPAGGCGTSTPGVATVKMQGLAFQPQTITIKKGTSVRWVNNDQTVHTSTAADYQAEKTNPLAWASPILNPGQTYDRRFDTAGSFSYSDTIHGYMTGNITVTE